MNKPFLIALIICVLGLGFVSFPKIWRNLSERTTENTHGIIEQKEVCIDVVMEILTTSQAYLQETDGLNEAVVKNGGTGIMIETEGSPNPERDDALGFSDTYDFCLRENYPDHVPVVTRFTFNPTERQLYKYDHMEDELILIEFNRDLLLKFNKMCK